MSRASSRCAEKRSSRPGFNRLTRANGTDRNERKAIGGRLNTRNAGIEGLRLGTSAVWGGGSGEARRDRATADVLVVRGALKLKSEIGEVK